jgi:death-on-curing protein
VGRIYTENLLIKLLQFFESIISNHPFIDGNKRTGYALMRLMLLNDSKDIQTNQVDKYTFVIQAA